MGGVFSDEELVKRWRDGDREAGRLFIERHHDGVVRFFFNKTSAASQEDLVQQTFLAFIGGLTRLDELAKARAFLFGAAYRLLCKHYETQRVERDRTVQLPDPPQIDSPSGAMTQREEHRLLLRGLRRLPLDYQVPLELHYWERMTTAEIGEILGIPGGTVKSRLRRGRELLVEAMESLAHSADLLKSTTDGFDRWAGSIRDGIVGGARRAEPPPGAPPEAPMRPEERPADRRDRG